MMILAIVGICIVIVGVIVLAVVSWIEHRDQLREEDACTREREVWSEIERLSKAIHKHNKPSKKVRGFKG